MHIDAEYVEIESLKELTEFVKYNPKAKKSVVSGFVLGKDIDFKGGGKLFTKGTELDDAKLEKLHKLQERTESEFAFSIERNERLKGIISKRLIGLFKSMITSRSSRTEFRKMMSRIEKSLDNYLPEIFEKDDLVYILYESYFKEKNILRKGRPIYFYHMINTVLFSVGIVLESFKISDFKFTTDDIKNIIIASILNNIGPQQALQGFIELKESERKEKYFELNKTNFEVAKQLNYDIVIAETLEKVCYFHFNEKEFLEKDKKSDLYASIIIVADLYDQQLAGFFQNSKPPKEAADKLYVMANQKELKKIFVDALAKGLKFTDLFDFYNEIERLIGECLYNKSGKPYPMTGFLSPTIFVCGNNVEKCKHFSGATKSINIIKKSSGLSEGSYGRCELLSPRLISFYEEHYEQIKEDVIERQMGEMKQKENN